MNAKQTKLKTPLRIAIFLALGFAIAMILMTIAIYFGYRNAYNHCVDHASIILFGMEIYTLTKAGAEYTGASIGTNMGILCMAIMAVTVGIEEIAKKLIDKKHH